MLALASVWIALATLLVAAGMFAYRPLMTDLTVISVLYFGTPGAWCLAGLVLWAHRHETSPDPGLAARRVQAKVAIALGLFAAAIVYALIIGSQKLEPIERSRRVAYNQPPGVSTRSPMSPHYDAGHDQRPTRNT